MKQFARGRIASFAAMALSMTAPMAASASGAIALTVAAGLGLAGSTYSASAQAQTVKSETPEQRLRRMESEIRALQRKVFPDGAGRTFAPEITAPTTGSPQVGSPASNAVIDLLARMESLESQMTRLTAQVEETQNRLTKLEAQVASGAPIAAPSDSVAPQQFGAATGTSSGSSNTANTSTMSVSSAKPVARAMPAPAAPSIATPKAAQPSADRVAAVQAIEKTQSNDRGEDEYLYGFRLWEARLYPEAQQQLLRFVEQFPGHRRISYGRNLLGRAYLDDNKPGTAAQYLLQNYQANPNGERAADSLLYLAVAMTRLKETKRACVALAELTEKYPSEVNGRLSNQVTRARSGVKCN